jgi:hypothetical protein
MVTTDSAGANQWSLEIDAGRIAWLTFDKPNASANALSRAAMEQLDEWLTGVERAAPRGLVICSAKSGFVAGADIGEFGQVRSPEEAVPFIRAAHGILARLERLPWAAASNSPWRAATGSAWTIRRRRSACPRSCSASTRDSVARCERCACWA